jgi:uncharacterized membrane protein
VGLAIAFGTLTMAGFALVFVGVLGMFERLPPNRIAGIRTRYTFSREQAWYDTHRFAGPVMALGGVAIVAAGLAFLPFAATGALPRSLAVTVLAVMAMLALGVAALSWRYGTRQARAAASSK